MEVSSMQQISSSKKHQTLLFRHLWNMQKPLLVEALEELNKQALVFEKYNLELLEAAEFASVFKKRLFLGEDFELTINTEDRKDSVETVSINSKPQNLVKELEKTQLIYRPQSWGSILLKYRPPLNDSTLFEVVRPRLRFLSQEELIDLTLGQPQSISIDKKFIPRKGLLLKAILLR